MTSVTAPEFVSTTSHARTSPFSLLEQKGLGSRLIDELNAAFIDIRRDPKGFLRSVVSTNARDLRSRRRIQVGLAIALLAHLGLLGLIAVFGWRSMFDKKHTIEVTMLPMDVHHGPMMNVEPEVPKGDSQGGSGGGGDHNPLPATKGPLPQAAPIPQVVKPNSPSAPLPTIQLPPTIQGFETAAPPPGSTLGVPTGVAAEAPSPGPGSNDGLGGKSGTGAGPGSGPGSGPGERGPGTGGRGRTGSPNGSEDTLGPIPNNTFNRFPERTGIVWLHRPTPIVTPEAEANKVMGEVLLRATFHDDGTISDIEIVRQVPYMTQSAIDSLMHSRFRPATVKGRPVTLTGVLVRISVDVIRQ